MIADDLLRTQITEWHGQVWACGTVDGLPYVEMSDDSGATKRVTRRPVTSWSMAETPGLAAYVDSSVWAALAVGGQVKVYRSRTQGETQFDLVDSFD